jgi:hypothetical protein
MNAEERKRLDLQERYGASQEGNFQIADTIGVPHPYCITPKHVSIASDDHGGMLGEAAIRDAEKRGARCGIRQCNLSYQEHGQALLVSCKADIKDSEGKVNAELHAYLLTCKDMCEADKYVGFAFVKAS